MTGEGGTSYGTSGFDASLTGAKKEQHLSINAVLARYFSTNSQSCLGDSGIIMLDGNGKALGISSAVSPDGSDPFLGPTTLVRADSHHAWIQDVMAE
jgi:hypothetical protein